VEGDKVEKAITIGGVDHVHGVVAVLVWLRKREA